MTSASSEVIHTPQTFKVLGFLVLHLGHFIAIATPLFSHVWSAKGYQGTQGSVKLNGCVLLTLQPSQPLPGILYLSNTRVGVLPEVEEFLFLLFFHWP